MKRDTQWFRLSEEQKRNSKARQRIWNAAHRVEVTAAIKAWKTKHPEVVAAWKKRYRQLNPEKIFAHRRLNAARKRGDIIRPDRCSECQKACIPSGHHHKGYDYPLDVIWLCRACHIKVHFPLSANPPEYHPNPLRVRFSDDQISFIKASPDSNRRLGKKLNVSREMIRRVRCNLKLAEYLLIQLES